MDENDVSRHIIEAALEVHRTLGGPGLLESVYEAALTEELRLRNVAAESQLVVPIIYKGRDLGHQLRLDLLVENSVIVECKATTKYSSVFEAQVLTYLRLMNLRLGLVINFGEPLIKNGLHRVVNGL
jgi:GxxExxY protein